MKRTLMLGAIGMVYVVLLFGTAKTIAILCC
jgi:hypothetical protein